MNFYSGYRVHNYHFAAYGAMFLGQYAPAIAAADELIATMPEAMLRIPSPPMADFFESYVSIRQHVLVRFGKWREIIAQDLPVGRRPLLQHRGDDALRQGRRPRGAGRCAGGGGRTGAVPRGRQARAQVPADAQRVLPADCWPSPRRCWRAKSPTAAASMTTAFAHLRAAVALEDDLPYDEPWGWMQPVRHALGALLLEQGRAAEAEAVYREDLGLGGALPRAQIHPDNVWALRGLLDCLDRRGETVEAKLIRQRLDVAAARADVAVSVSCFCAGGDASTAATQTAGCCA